MGSFLMLANEKNCNSNFNGKDKGMRLSSKQISELQTLLKDLHGVILSNEQAQAAGLAIMRFVYVKELQKRQLMNKEIKNE